jgi:hypothetical protein
MFHYTFTKNEYLPFSDIPQLTISTSNAEFWRDAINHNMNTFEESGEMRYLYIRLN